MKKALTKELASHLAWQRRHPKLPVTPKDAAVRRLVYGEHETPMGLVCKIGKKYWSFTTSPAIVCMPAHQYLIQYKLEEDAAQALFDYVVEELYRITILNSKPPFILARSFKERDRAAFKAYTDEPSNKAHADVEQAFKCGMDWMLRCEGFPRRPSWAEYLVQNRDGTFVWFEHQPKTNMHTGKWECETGRMREVVLEEDWYKGIRHLT